MDFIFRHAALVHISSVLCFILYSFAQQSWKNPSKKESLINLKISYGFSFDLRTQLRTLYCKLKYTAHCREYKCPSNNESFSPVNCFSPQVCCWWLLFMASSDTQCFQQKGAVASMVLKRVWGHLEEKLWKENAWGQIKMRLQPDTFSTQDISPDLPTSSTICQIRVNGHGSNIQTTLHSLSSLKETA